MAGADPPPALCRARMMEMTKGKVSLHVLLLLLLLILGCFTCPLRLYAAANSGHNDLSTRSHLADSSVIHRRANKDFLTEGRASEEDQFVRGRKVIQLEDYPGSGANDRHDPRKG